MKKKKEPKTITELLQYVEERTKIILKRYEGESSSKYKNFVIAYDIIVNGLSYKDARVKYGFSYDRGRQIAESLKRKVRENDRKESLKKEGNDNGQ